MFTPSFTPRGEHSLLFRRMEGRTENFTPGRGQNPYIEYKREVSYQDTEFYTVYETTHIPGKEIPTQFAENSALMIGKTVFLKRTCCNSHLIKKHNGFSHLWVK
jgi:hypothetical protein